MTLMLVLSRAPQRAYRVSRFPVGWSVQVGTVLVSGKVGR